LTNRFSCALNGVTPESLDPSIRVTDLTELPPRMRVVTAPTLHHGLRLLRRIRESLTVRVSFLITEYDPARRRELLQRLHAWADPGGLLSFSDRPGQQLRVECDTLPTLNALSWSDEMSLSFTAYAVPFWEMAEEDSVTTAGSTSWTLPGTADECPVAVTVTNKGAAPLTTLHLACDDTRMTFEGLSLPVGGVFTLTQDGTAIIDGTAAFLARTDDSSDLLLADCGKPVAVSVSGDQPVQAVFRGRGRLL